MMSINLRSSARVPYQCSPEATISISSCGRFSVTKLLNSLCASSSSSCNLSRAASVFSPNMIRHEEGSVSMPGVTEEIERHAHVRMSYQDLSGVEMVEEADGMLSVCHQHT